jgi:hypothetical protein
MTLGKYRNAGKSIELLRNMRLHCEQRPDAHILIVNADGTEPSPTLVQGIELLKGAFPHAQFTFKKAGIDRFSGINVTAAIINEQRPEGSV